jgi:hypothetical protein
MMINWTDVLIAAVGLFFTAVLVPLVKAGFEWLKDKTANEALLTALSEAQTVADTVIGNLQQTVVEGMKAANEDGKLTGNEAQMISQSAIEGFMADISKESLEVLSRRSSDIEAYVKRLIESRLLALKSGG